jgi:hypothetical protein
LGFRGLNSWLVRHQIFSKTKTAALCAVPELAFGSGSALGLRLSVQRIFCFLVVIFFGSSGVELDFLDFLGEASRRL